MSKQINYLFFIFIFFIIFCEITAQYLFKKSFITKQSQEFNLFLIVGIILYSIIGFFVFKILDYGEIIIVNIIWHLLHFIILFLIGYFVFKEKLSFKKIIASIIGMIAIIIFLFDNHHH
jgi:drug/metabolite transporter (DMT)-like permease